MEQLMTNRLLLRELNWADRDALSTIGSTDDVHTLAHYYLQTQWGVERFLNSCFKFNSQRNPFHFSFGIVLRETTELVGLIELSAKKPFEDSSSGLVSYFLGADYRGNGYMGESIEQVCSFGFHAIELDTLWAKVLPENTKSAQLLVSGGFTYQFMKKDPMNRKYGWYSKCASQ